MHQHGGSIFSEPGHALPWLTAGAGTLTALLGALPMMTPTWRDWIIASAAGRELVSGGLDVYAQMPEAQMGPLALGLAGALPYPVYVVSVCLLLFPTLLLAISALRPATLTIWHAVGAVLLGYPWHRFAVTGHADDALVLFGLVLAMFGSRRRQPKLVALGFAVALAAKPTAIIFFPLAIILGSSAVFLGALVVGALAWAPFVLSDVQGFLSAGQGIVTVASGSLPHLMGVDAGAPFPSWVRPAQLVLGTVVVALLGMRSPVAAVAVGYCVRTMLEPGAFPAYTTSVIGAALLVDIAYHRFPTGAVLGFMAWLIGFDYTMTTQTGLQRIALLLFLALIVTVSAVRSRSRLVPHVYSSSA